MVWSLSLRTLFAALFAATYIGSALPALAETVLLDFSSSTCGPCQQMRPTIQRLIADGLPVREVDIDREPQLASEYGVTRVPTFLVVVDGRTVDQVVGPTSYAHLHRILRSAMPAPSPRPRAVPNGQSPSTFANTPPATLNRSAPHPGYNNANSLSAESQAVIQNQYESQPNRIISQQGQAAGLRHQQESANLFDNGLSTRPAITPAGSPDSSFNSAHQRLLSATVKLTVEDPQGKSSGTGTIVDARSGEALVLTCGHIFRSSGGKGPITVTTFQATPTGAIAGASYQGHLIDFDLERDLALVSLRPTSPVSAVPIASAAVNPLHQGAAVTSVGCNHGQNPTAIDSRVVALNRYQGPPNVEVAGAPVEGRSGGGLFNAQGQLVGVCYAADPQSNEGLYAGLASIYAKLDSLDLTMIYQPQAVAAQAPSTPSNSFASMVEPPSAVRGQEPEPARVSVQPQPTSPTVASLPAAERAALAEIQRRGTNSEVICIIRPQDPSGKSEVITLSNASPAFVQALANPRSPTISPAQRAQQSGGDDPFFR